MTRGGVGWVVLAAIAGMCALAGWWIPHDLIDWQPGLAWHAPWRAVSAVGVHYSLAHLLGNLGGLLLVALLGWFARAPWPIAVAWGIAWPLTQYGLLIESSLAHYGGLSGMLHAGVAAVAVGLLLTEERVQRIVASLLLAGLAAKVLGEGPWGAPLRYSPRLGMAVAPLAHATGTLAGAACAAVAVLLARRPRLRGCR